MMYILQITSALFFLLTTLQIVPPQAPVDRPSVSTVSYSNDPSKQPLLDSIQSILASTWVSGADGYDETRNLQKQSREPIILYFYADWCPFCNRLSRDILIAPEVQSLLREVRHVRVNVPSGDRERKLAERYGVTGFPTFLVVSTDSTRRLRIRPFKKGIAMSPSQFVQSCRKAMDSLKNGL